MFVPMLVPTLRNLQTIFQPLVYPATPFPEKFHNETFADNYIGLYSSPPDRNAYVPDLDEAAGASGRALSKIPWLSKIVSRSIMLVGGVWALWGCWQTCKDLHKNWQTAKFLRVQNLLRGQLKSGPQVDYSQQARRNSRNFMCNVFLFVGNLGMAINLLASAELLGGFWVLLQPFSVWAMRISAPMMAIYGALLTCLVMSGHYSAENNQRLLITLGVSGLLQSIGAMLQLTPWAVPALLPLLLGTFGIMFCTLYLDKRIENP